MTQTPPAEDDETHAKRMAGKRFLGGLLMAVGGLIALLCGMCTLVFLNNSWASEALIALLASLVLGGIPSAVGVALFLLGRSIYRDGLRNHAQ